MAMTGYLYDAMGNRVAKGTISGFYCDPTGNGLLASPGTMTNYVVGLNGEQLDEYDGIGANLVHSNVFGDGRLLATLSASTWKYAFNDWLGTKRAQITADGNLANLYTFQSLPFGEAPVTNVPDATEQHFTGKERDNESQNEYFDARYYSSGKGRFLSPDWSAKAEPVPYAKLDDPQSMNLYSYVQNNPLSRIDPAGHDWVLDFLTRNTSAAQNVLFQGQLAQQAQQQNVQMSTTYKTATGAARAALDGIIGQSEKSGWEYGGRIVQLANGKYAYTLATTDKSNTFVDVDAGMKEGTRIPAGTANAGMYHTHPTSCENCAHDQFSGADNAIAVREQLPSYMESGATRSIYLLDGSKRSSILDPTPPTVIRYGPPQ